jgi:hypothetical protein
MEDVTLANQPAPAIPAKLARAGTAHTTAWNGGEFSFRDLIDTINPLQHIPVVSTLYRAITGDNGIGNIPRMVGDMLFGGPIGLFTSVIGIAVKEETGRDIGEHAVALIYDPASSNTAVAGAEAAPAAPADALATASTEAPSVPVAPGAEPTPAAAAVAAVPAHRAMSLVRTAAAAPSAAVAGPTLDPAQRDFLAQGAALQRRLAGASSPRSPAPIPLQSSSVPGGAGRIRPMPVAATAPVGAPAMAAGALPQNPPIEISQQMMAALDKYAQMQRARAATVATGATVDLVQ